MPKSMIRFLSISLLALFCFSCKSYQVANAVPTASTVTEFHNPYFADPAMDYVYKATITIYGNQLSGIFIAKKTDEATHRVVFTTDFGNTLLDFEISQTDFKVNYIVEDLNRKMVITTLRDDFRLLLKTVHAIENVLQSDDFLIYKSASGKYANYFFESKADHKLVKMVHASKSKEKVVFDFASKNSTFAENIIIQHHNIKLKIALTQITN